jgi:hypothetical protein
MNGRLTGRNVPHQNRPPDPPLFRRPVCPRRIPEYFPDGHAHRVPAGRGRVGRARQHSHGHGIRPVERRERHPVRVLLVEEIRQPLHVLTPVQVRIGHEAAPRPPPSPANSAPAPPRTPPPPRGQYTPAARSGPQYRCAPSSKPAGFPRQMPAPCRADDRSLSSANPPRGAPAGVPPWGRLATCGGLSTRPRRRLPTGAQDTILPHRGRTTTSPPARTAPVASLPPAPPESNTRTRSSSAAP